MPITSLKVDFQGSRVTSNGGLILVRELDERLGLEKLHEEYLSDSRQGMNKQFTLFELDTQEGICKSDSKRRYTALPRSWP